MDVVHVELCGLVSAAVGRLHQGMKHHFLVCAENEFVLVWSAARVISCFISELLALFHPRQPLVVSPMTVSICSERNVEIHRSSFCFTCNQ